MILFLLSGINAFLLCKLRQKRLYTETKYSSEEPTPLLYYITPVVATIL